MPRTTESDEILTQTVDEATDSFVTAVRAALDVWAQTAAPQGPQGPVGPQGPPGTQGPQGDRGSVGSRGDPGHPGEQGPMGPAGAPGRSGAQGAEGPIGPQGLIGPEGPHGPEGPVGPVGPQGIQGPRGNEGPPGPQGPMRPRPPVNIFTQNYTFSHSDQDSTIHAESMNDVIYTIPNTLPAEFYCRIIQTGIGKVKFIPGPGSNLVNRREHTTTAGKFSEVFIRCIGTVTFLLTGDTA